MAEFTTDLNPKSNYMSLGDMMKMGLYGAETQIAQREAQMAHAKAKELPLVQSFLSGPDSKDENGQYDLDKVNTVLPTIAPISGPDYASKINGLVKNHTEATKAKMDLSNTARGVMGSFYGAHAAAGTQDPEEVKKGMIHLAEQMPELKPYIAPALRNLENVPAGQAFNKALYQARNEFMSTPQQIEAFAPKAGMSKIGGADVPIVTRPSVMGEAPSVTPTQFGSGTGGYSAGGTTGATAPKPTTEETGKRMPAIVNYGAGLKYTQDPSWFNLNDAQKKVYDKGDEMVNSIGAGLKAAKDIQQPIRKVEEYINSASGSKLYQTLQAGGKYAWGNSDLDSLVKNVASIQARNAEVMGLSKTDHMQDLNAKLSGSEKIDPKALAGVMQQVKADAVAAEKYNNGLQKFVEKHGDINGRILATKFQQAWAENYDPRIFQQQDIENSNLPEIDKQRRIAELHSTMTKDEYKELDNKAKVLYRLEKGLYQ